MLPEVKLPRECLVTTGATAAFPELIKSALSHQSLQAFVNNDFTHINFQCGDAINVFELWKPSINYDLVLRPFAFNTKGLSEEMIKCQEREGISRRGLVICHAGAGTIIETLRYSLPAIVVPNPSFLENHQDELARELERQGYATRSDVKSLPRAIYEACQNEFKAWTGKNSSLAPIVDEVVGYEKDLRAQLD